MSRLDTGWCETFTDRSLVIICSLLHAERSSKHLYSCLTLNIFGCGWAGLWMRRVKSLTMSSTELLYQIKLKVNIQSCQTWWRKGTCSTSQFHRWQSWRISVLPKCIYTIHVTHIVTHIHHLFAFLTCLEDNFNSNCFISKCNHAYYDILCTRWYRQLVPWGCCWQGVRGSTTSLVQTFNTSQSAHKARVKRERDSVVIARRAAKREKIAGNYNTNNEKSPRINPNHPIHQSHPNPLW